MPLQVLDASTADGASAGWRLKFVAANIDVTDPEVLRQQRAQPEGTSGGVALGPRALEHATALAGSSR